MLGESESRPIHHFAKGFRRMSVQSKISSQEARATNPKVLAFVEEAKKLFDYLMRRGFSYDLIVRKVREAGQSFDASEEIE